MEIFYIEPFCYVWLGFMGFIFLGSIILVPIMIYYEQKTGKPFYNDKGDKDWNDFMDMME